MFARAEKTTSISASGTYGFGKKFTANELQDRIDRAGPHGFRYCRKYREARNGIGRMEQNGIEDGTACHDGREGSRIGEASGGCGGYRRHIANGRQVDHRHLKR
jgi:hypothetical protein